MAHADEATTFLREHGVHPFIEAAAGNPALAILDTAQALHADLVVLGGGDSRRWQRLLAGLECDVLVVAAKDDVLTVRNASMAESGRFCTTPRCIPGAP